MLEEGIFFFTSLSALSKKQRELLIDTRSRFLLRITGLSFSSAGTKGLSPKPYGSSIATTKNYATTNNYATTTSSEPAYSIGENLYRGANNQGVYKGYGQDASPAYSCPTFNYYNVFHSNLNFTLNGDIYLLDLNGNVLDIYSRSVSFFKKPGQSFLYRDHRYFIYHRSNMPLTINR